jgi:Rv2258c-like winged HTH domain
MKAGCSVARIGSVNDGDSEAMLCQQRRDDFDPAKAEALAGHSLTALNHRALCLMASIGHRTGLFDVLRTLPP